MKPIYSLKKYKHMRQPEMDEQPKAQPAAQPAVQPETEALKPQMRFNNKLVVGVVVVSSIVAVIYLYNQMSSSSSKAQREEDAFVKEQARYEAEVQEYERQRGETLERFNAIKSERETLMAQLKKNHEEATTNSQDFERMFSGEQDMQEEDDINKAFMLSGDLDKKKAAMIQRGQQLGEQKKQLMDSLNHNSHSWNETANFYNQHFEGEPLPVLNQRK